MPRLPRGIIIKRNGSNPVYKGEGQDGGIDGICRGIASPTLPHPGAFDFLLMQISSTIPYLPRTGGGA